MQDYLIILKSGKIFPIIAYSLLEAVSAAQEFETGMYGNLFECGLTLTETLPKYSIN